MDVSEVPQPTQVTAADLYRELVGMRSDLGRVLTHQEAVDVRNKNADSIHIDHESRIRLLEQVDAEDFKELKGRVNSLEKFRWMLVGAMILIEVATTVVIVLISNHSHL